MTEAGYPKWVQRDKNVGAVLCSTADEEKQVLDDWKAEQAALAKEAADAKAKADAEAAEQAQVQLKTQGKGK